MELKVIITQKGAIFDGRAPRIIQKALEAAMYEATAFLEQAVKSRTPVRLGNLRGSIHGEPIYKGGQVVKGIVAHGMLYGDLVERGTGIYGPFHKGFEIKPKNGKALFWKGAKHPVKSVFQEGFPGRHMFEKALEENWSTLEDIFDRMGFAITQNLKK